MSFVIAAVYKFFKLEDPDRLAEELKALFSKNGILGTVILAKEGINGSVCATRSGIDAFKKILEDKGIFEGSEYKEATSLNQVFKRSKVKVKQEIITFKQKVDPTKMVGEYVEPKDWNDLISHPDVIVVDTRNDYEFKIGTFKNAINPETKKFSDFVEFVERKLADKKDKPIAMMCTGGVRCEKSTSYLISKGFKRVYHLKGGILRYLQEVPEKDSLWIGECFVFDNRVAVKHGLRIGDSKICFGCGTVLSPEELNQEGYEEGVSCPSCINNKSELSKRRFRARMAQIRASKSKERSEGEKEKLNMS